MTFEKIAYKILFLAVVALSVPAAADETRLEGAGQFGAGVYIPSGPDADLARVAPAFQLLAAVGLSPHLGFEVEYGYVPLRLEPGLFPFADQYRSSQMTVLAGVRFASGHFLGGAPVGQAYAGLRVGFARLVTSTQSAAPSGSWIAGTVDEANNPSGAPGFTTRDTEVGLALSPRPGFVLRLSRRAGLDLSAYPVFIINRGELTTQYYVSANLVFWAWQTF